MSHDRFTTILLGLFVQFFSTQSIFAQDALFPVRALGLSATTFFTFDLEFQLPLQLADLNMNLEVDVEIPFRIRFMNHTLEYHAIKVPYFVLPEPKPMTFDLSGGEKKPHKYYHYDYDPYSYDTELDQYDSNYFDDEPAKRSWFSFGSKSNKKSSTKKKHHHHHHQSTNGDPEYYRKYENYGAIQAKKRNDHSKEMNDNSIDNEPTINHNSGNFSLNSLRYYHKRHRRSVAAASVNHRMDFFQVLEHTMNLYGLDGRECLCRAVCEMAEMEFLIETPMHEIVEHLLRVSRANDEEGNLLEYIDAEKYGHESYQKQQYDACSKRYSNCPFSIFNRFHSQ